MRKNKIYIVGIVLIIGVAAFTFNYFYLGNPRLILHNVSGHDIDSIEVAVTGNTYFIKKLPSGTKKTIRIDPVTDSHVELFTQNKKNKIVIDVYLDRASTGGYIEANITKDSLISFKYERGIL